MIDFVIEDRDMIIQAVLDGILSAEHITMEEIQDLEEVVFEEICDQLSPFECWETEQ
jgi:hypothetical protein